MMGGIPLYEGIVPLKEVNPDQLYLFGKPKPVAVVAPVQTQSGESDQLRKMVQQMQGTLLWFDNKLLGIFCVSVF